MFVRPWCLGMSSYKFLISWQRMEIIAYVHNVCMYVHVQSTLDIFNFCVILTLHILTLSIIYSSLLCSPATGRGSPRCPRRCPCWAGHSAARGSCWSPRRRPPRPRTARCSTAPGSGTARTDTPVISGIILQIIIFHLWPADRGRTTGPTLTSPSPGSLCWPPQWSSWT